MSPTPSAGRDGLALLRPEQPVDDYASLVQFLYQLNAEWVRAARRISPPLYEAPSSWLSRAFADPGSEGA